MANVDGAYLTDEKGKTTLSKFAQVIPEDTTNDAGPIGIKASGSKQTEFKQRSALQHFHDLALAFLRGKGPEGEIIHLAPRNVPQRRRISGRSAQSWD